MKVPPPPVPPEPMPGSFPSTLEEGLRFRMPAFIGAAALAALSLALPVISVIDPPRDLGWEPSDPLVIAWVVLAPVSVAVNAFALYRARAGRAGKVWSRKEQGSRQLGIYVVGDVAWRAVFPAMFGSLVAFGEIELIVLLGTTAAVNLVLAWLLVPYDLSNVQSSRST